MNYLLGLTDKTSKKIKEDNLLNFYLSSVTIKNFNYEPKKNTKKIIWEYLNASNLIKINDYQDNMDSLSNLTTDERAELDEYNKMVLQKDSLNDIQKERFALPQIVHPHHQMQSWFEFFVLPYNVKL